jgi:hypothetical protein
MTWYRVINRNHLEKGEYNGTPEGNISGDLRRLRENTLDERHIGMYAELSGATPEQVKAIFDTFFDHFENLSAYWRS